MKYAYFGHHKCASTWISHILQSICIESGINHWTGQIQLLSNVQIQNCQKMYDFLICSNTDSVSVEKLQMPFKAIHVIRDPRDIIVSGYFSHLKTHPIKAWTELEKHRKELSKLSAKEGIIKEMSFSQYFLKHIYFWNYNQPNILELKMEEITIKPLESFRNILHFMGMLEENNFNAFSALVNRLLNRCGCNVLFKNPLNEKRLEEIITKWSFQRITNGRSIGQTNNESHYRKGISGDWKNYFDDDLKKIFNEKFGDILIKTRYENDNNW